MLTGDEQPTAGAAYINGFDTERDRVVASMLTGYCPQADAFCPSLTPRENLHIFAVLRGISKRNLAPHVNELLSRTGLAGSESDVASEFLSVGNKRKLSVAIALIGNPPVVILDEPTAGIDPP
uniref:ABC transporter domain-containing protein n=1 Tax=Panagrolaimus superbus TaxID=310955 RepID=A0A914XQF3_9BILA